MEMEKEFEQIDKAGSWAAIYQFAVLNAYDSTDAVCKVLRKPRGIYADTLQSVQKAELSFMTQNVFYKESLSISLTHKKLSLRNAFGHWSRLSSSALIPEMDIRHEASDFPCRVAKLPKNKNRNRYRDVSPFDHSRIKLHQEDNDYINASLIKMEEAQRSYILTQGPLPNTCGHFWEMVWEQKSRGVVMLNRVMEKGSLKCAQYWPQKEEEEMIFEDTNLKLTLISEDIKSYYTVRQLELENLT
ncbi:hypothetical protein EI555_007216, partial [Monodon monoceros]